MATYGCWIGNSYPPVCLVLLFCETVDAQLSRFLALQNQVSSDPFQMYVVLDFKERKYQASVQSVQLHMLH